MKIFIIPVIAVVIDQLTKFLVRQTMAVGRSIPVAGDAVRLTHVENPGMVFGIQLENYTLFTLVSVAVVCLIAVYFYRTRHSGYRVRLAFSLILGGAVGNQIDRILFRRVTDFVDVNIPDIIIGSNKLLGFALPSYSLYRWPVFNAADAWITIGMVIIFWLLLFTKEKVI